MGNVYRVLESSGDDEEDERPVMVPLDEWLADLEAERDSLIMRLRAIERPLVKYGRLRVESLPRRMR